MVKSRDSFVSSPPLLSCSRASFCSSAFALDSVRTRQLGNAPVILATGVGLRLGQADADLVLSNLLVPRLVLEVPLDARSLLRVQLGEPTLGRRDADASLVLLDVGGHTVVDISTTGNSSSPPL